MTDDVSYEMMKRGHKVRILNRPLDIDNRHREMIERTRTMPAGSVEFLKNKAAELKARLDRIEAQGTPPSEPSGPQFCVRVRNGKIERDW